jgi:N-acetylmuramoyl-L-alanine amidase
MSIKQSFVIIFLCTLTLQLFARRSYYSEPKPNYRMTIMIDPTAHARIIDGCFEFGIALQCAEQLKQKLEEEYHQLRIVLTRRPGETVQPLQNANFANRLEVDFYLSIHFYQETDTKPKLSLYYFSSGNDLVTKTFDLCFYPYDQAYIFNKAQTDEWAHNMKQSLSQENYASLFEVKGPYAVPFKPLIGIKAPAIAIEASLKHVSDWKQYIDPIITSLRPIITTYQRKTDEA